MYKYFRVYLDWYEEDEIASSINGYIRRELNKIPNSNVVVVNPTEEDKEELARIVTDITP